MSAPDRTPRDEDETEAEATTKGTRLHRGGAPARAVPVTSTSRKKAGPALRRAVVPSPSKPPSP